MRNVCLALVEKMHFQYRRMKVAALFNIYVLNFNFRVLWGIFFIYKIKQKKVSNFFKEFA